MDREVAGLNTRIALVEERVAKLEAEERTPKPKSRKTKE